MLSTLSMAGQHISQSGLSIVPPLPFWLLADSSEHLRDVYIRGVRGDLWDWLFVWKERQSYGFIINVLLEEWRNLDERERHRIILKYQRPDR